MSCKTGRGINELRDIIFDVASQVRENTGEVAVQCVCVCVCVCVCGICIFICSF